eukprot:UC4_evm1s1117
MSSPTASPSIAATSAASSVLDQCLAFYRRFRHPKTGCLAYIVQPPNRVSYDYSCPIRNLMDVHAFLDLGMVEMLPPTLRYSSQAITIKKEKVLSAELVASLTTTLSSIDFQDNSNSPNLIGAYSARLLLFVNYGSVLDPEKSRARSEITRLLHFENPDIPGTFSLDIAFQSPQVVLAICTAAISLTSSVDLALVRKVAAAAVRFVAFCARDRRFEKAVVKYNAFIANWTCQAVGSAVRLFKSMKTLECNREGFLTDAEVLVKGRRAYGKKSLIDICVERMMIFPSICEEACALEGLAALAMAGIYDINSS